MPPPIPQKWSRRPPSPPPRRPRRRQMLLLVSLVALGIVLYLAPDRYHRPRSAPQPEPVEPQPLRYVTLFYADAAATGLVSVIRQRPPCANDASCALDVVQALMESPPEGLVALFPPQTQVTRLELAGDGAVIDLPQDSVNRLSGGVMNEVLLLTGLADTLAVNFPQIRRVSVLVDGKAVKTLKGHVDLRQPFIADFSLVRNSTHPASPPAENGQSQE